MSAPVPTGLDFENPELTLESIDELDEFPQQLVRREQVGVQLAFVGTEAMRWVAGAGESGGVEHLAARFGLPAIQSAQAGLGDDARDPLSDSFAEILQRGRELMGGREGGLAPSAEPVVMTGAALGLPGPGTVHVRVERRLLAAMDS